MSNLPNPVILATDSLVPLCLFGVWLALRRSGGLGLGGVALALPLLAVLGWGLAGLLVPVLSAQRYVPPGMVQPILPALALLLGTLALPAVRGFFRTADPRALLAAAPWRAMFGLALLAIGLLGGLPADFFWSAALGDIAVGLWGAALMARSELRGPRMLLAWNLAGALDLAHVLALGSRTLLPFYLTQPGLEPLALLPIAGVPVLLALHVLTLWGMAARRAPRTA